MADVDVPVERKQVSGGARAGRRLAAHGVLRRIEIFLIKPTKYDDDGYLLRHFRGVLPSNTLATLHALTEDVQARGVLGSVHIRAHLCDESVQRVPQRRILRLARRRGTKVIVCLVGVQTSQFPRAAVLACRFRAQGLAVIIGGFHISGTLAQTSSIPPQLQQLLDAGVTLVKGEVEHTWAGILQDAARGSLAPLYDSSSDKPDLRDAPMPRLHPQVLRHFVYRHFGTVDTARGCPFTCSFCTIISVQGREVRSRKAAAIAAAIESNYRATGTHHYFLTDDNFARNKQWRSVLEELIRLREQQGVPVRFLMQVDVLAHRIPEFVTLAKRAGCFQVFIGMESLNPESLADGGKRQNKAAEYPAMIAAWHAADILTHVGIIIGFPHDTPSSVLEDIRTLKQDIRPDLATFFMLTPLPGSEDYAKILQAGTALDPDLNRHDTFHPVVDHPAMSRQEWFDAYRDAWRQFYTFDYMRQQLGRLSGHQHTTLLQLYLWYKSAAFIEAYHPMLTGFFRQKPRTDRRPGCAVESRLRHLRRRAPEVCEYLSGYRKLLRELRHLWVETRQLPACPQLQSRPSPTPIGMLRHLKQQVQLWQAFLGEMFGDVLPFGLAYGTPTASETLSLDRSGVADVAAGVGPLP